MGEEKSVQGEEGWSDVPHLNWEATLDYSHKLVFPMNRTFETPLAWWGIQNSEYKPRMIRRSDNLVREQWQIPPELCWTLSLAKRHSSM